MNWATARDVFRGDHENPKAARGLQITGMAWLATTSALAVAMLTVGVESASASGFSADFTSRFSTESGSPAEEMAAPSMIEPAETSDAAPSTLYGGLLWSLGEVRVVPRTSDAFSRPVVIAELIVANTGDTLMRVREADVAVVGPDGARHQVDRFEGTAESHLFTVEPGRAKEVTAVFKLVTSEDPWLAEYHLQIGEVSRIPATIPLEGPAEESPFPVPVSISDETIAVADPDRPGRSMAVQPIGALLDINAGPYRAAVGEQLTIVEVSVQRAGGGDEAAYLAPDFWALRIDGVTFTAARVTNDLRPSGEDRVFLLFATPADGDVRGELVAGVGGESPATFGIGSPAIAG